MIHLNYTNAAATYADKSGPDLTALMSGTPTLAGVAGGTINTVATFCLAGGAGNPAGLKVGDSISIPTAVGMVYAIVKDHTNGTGAAGNCAAGNTFISTNLTTNTMPVITSGTVQEIDPYTLIRNVKILDLDSGSTVQGPLITAAFATTKNGGVGYGVPNYATTSDYYYKDMTEDFELVGGQTRHLGILVDTDANLPAGYNLFASIRLSNTGAMSYVKDMAANAYVTTANIIGAGATALQGKMMTTAANSLAAVRASIPVNSTYVKGDDNVPALGMALTAGDAGDITIKKMAVRVYGVDNTVMGGVGTGWAGAVAGIGNWTNAQGNVAGNTLVSSVTLYDGNDVVDGPRSLTLVDMNGDGVYTAGKDFYRVLFDNLNDKVAKGSTKVFTVKAKLLNTMGTSTYLAMDLVPTLDIVAEDVNANTVIATGATLNGSADHNPLITVLTSGGLDISSEGNPDAMTVDAGTKMQLASKYRFSALREGFTINKLTVVDMGKVAGSFDPNSAATTSTAVSQVTLKYTDVNGVTQTKIGNLFSGKDPFSDLGFYVPAGQNKYLEIYADVNDFANSGDGFRLGLQDVGNSAASFDAVGFSSATSINSPTISNSNSINTMTVVGKSVAKVEVSQSPGYSRELGLNGTNKLLGFLLSTTNSSTGLKNLTFQVSSDPTLTLSQYKLYRGATFLADSDTPTTPSFTLNGEMLQPSNPQEYHLEAFVAGSQQTGLNVTTDLNEAGVVLSSGTVTIPTPISLPLTTF